MFTVGISAIKCQSQNYELYYFFSRNLRGNLWNFWYLTLNVEQIKGAKKLCSVWLRISLLLSGSERVTELKGTFQTEIAFSCVSKMKVVVYLSLLCSSDSIKYMLCTFSWKRNIKNLPWQTMTREVQTQDWEIYRNQHPNKEKRRNYHPNDEMLAINICFMF